MNQCTALLTELREQSQYLESLIASHNIEPALELIKSRLLLLEQLHSLAQKNEQNRILIQSLASELFVREQAMIVQLQEQQSAVTGLLSQALSANKAQQLYQQFNQE